VNPVDYGLEGNPVSNVYAKGSLVVFFDFSSDTDPNNFGWVLGDSGSNSILYRSDIPLVTNLNDVTWDQYYDTNATVPTTLCQQFIFSQSFVVTDSNVSRVAIPPGTMIDTYDVIETNRAIHSTSTAPISVYAVDYVPEGTAAFTGYPTPLLGTNYCLMARPANNGAEGSELAVVATQDHTTVTIHALRHRKPYLRPFWSLYQHPGHGLDVSNQKRG
jgi:hypothetical protein